ncbi:MAG TPA: DUF5313 family protein [Jatrophihabitantaceae bacterium]|jgi:hypothetical protein|nr:DUF5313 family protein [Jatrophihabitantaceae bacterium]
MIKQQRRPNPWQWIRYAFGAGLPTRLDEWVYRDLTGRAWIVRHLSRAITQLAPIILVVVLCVPGAAWIRAVMAIAGSVMALIYSVAYMVEATDHRMVKAGYPSGIAEAARKKRSAETAAAGVAKRRARAQARLTR